jgi:CBS domain-containing protein
MKIKDIMTPNVEFVSPDDTLQHAALKMQEMAVSPLPVCDRNDSIVGILTDRDVTVRAASAGLDPDSTLVRQVMSRAVSYCYEDEDAYEAARLMQGRQPARFFVLSRDERLAGVVSLAGLHADAGFGPGVDDLVEPGAEAWAE